MFDTTTFQPDCVILGAGDFPRHDIPLSLLRSAHYLCCCDGATQSLVERGVVPDAIVGDGDSLPQAFKERFKNILHIVTEQDDNDLTKATRFCMSQEYGKIAYIGATGKREDHTVGNISLLARYHHELRLQAAMFTDYGVFVPCEGGFAFRTFPRQQVSLFNMTCKTLSSCGLKYPAYATTEWWQGTLNEAKGTEITLHGDGVYIAYLTYEAKTAQPHC